MGHNETVANITRFVDGRRAFVELCVGPTLADIIRLDGNSAAFPLKPIGNYSNVGYGVDLMRSLGVPTDRAFQANAIEQGRPFQSVTALVLCGLSEPEFQAAKSGLSAHVLHTRALIAFFLAGELVPIVRIAWLEPKKGEVEFLAPRGLNGVPQRNKDDPVSADFLRNVHTSVEADNLFHYFLAILQSAQGEVDAAFRIARLFSLLEALAGPITGALKKQDEKIGSRTGVRALLGYYVDFDVPIFRVDGKAEYEFDHVELAGQLRDRLFHGGAILKQDDVAPALKPGVELLHVNPGMIAHALRRDCERELVAYAQHTGRAWRSRQGEVIPRPERIPPEKIKDLAKLHVTGTSSPTGSIGSIYVQVTGTAACLARLEVVL